ncbi:MAG: hypothetical protein NTY01_12095 [Verrucomicrobia bacterium]|nr:hypothetical protein [Verrucomicrobiota bacterium]
MNRDKRSARGGCGIALLLAAAMTLRADVLVLKNGTLLLGRPTATTADSISLAVGAAGTVMVRLGDVRQMIACPPAEEPDSYFKAAQRAGRAGWFAEAFACCDKSAAVEPSNAAAARALRAALQQQSVVEAKAAARTAAASQPLSEIERQRAEAQRMIAEGEKQLKQWEMAANYDTKNRGPMARLVQEQGEANMKLAQAKIDQGKAMLEKIEKATAPPPPPPPPPPPTTSQQAVQWAWLLGLGAVGLLVVWFILKPFLPRQ